MEFNITEMCKNECLAVVTVLKIVPLYFQCTIKYRSKYLGSKTALCLLRIQIILRKLEQNCCPRKFIMFCFVFVKFVVAYRAT